MEDLIRSQIPVTVQVIEDEYTKICSKAFDYQFSGASTFNPWELPKSLPKEFGIGLIVGGSGSGKSKMLNLFGSEQEIEWDHTKAIISHFESPDEAVNKLSAVGLNTIPAWVKPYHVLSNGERFRADLARRVGNNAVIDEFTSVVDRNVAKASSVALSRYVKKNGIKNVVLASCHRDIVDWLEPDWVIDTDTGKFYEGFFLSDPQLKLKYLSPEPTIGSCLKTIII